MVNYQKRRESFSGFMKTAGIVEFLVITCLLTTFLTSCIKYKGVEEEYAKAVAEASVVEKKDINKNLIPVILNNEDLIWNRDKTRVLMVMWKSWESYNRYYKDKKSTDPSEDYVTWVTTAPQVKNFGKEFLKRNPSASKKDVDLRLKQYLGLKPEWDYDIFVELWVKPEQLFRPCVDPEISDKRCDIGFRKQLPSVKGIKDYQNFYRKLYYDDFRELPGIPWTGMGYTYDWGSSESPFGASEFIIIPGGSYEIRSVTKTIDYIKK